jgi:hypothetical protein
LVFEDCTINVVLKRYYKAKYDKNITCFSISNFDITVLEREIETGLVNTETPHDRCVVIERTLDHVTSGIGQESTSDYIDVADRRLADMEHARITEYRENVHTMVGISRLMENKNYNS